MSATGHCRLCGTEVPDERHGYCEGPLCGADLAGQRVGDPGVAVQVGFERARVAARPGEVVEARLLVRNRGRRAERFRIRVFDTERVAVTEPEPGAPIGPGAEVVWTVRYRVPRDPGPLAAGPAAAGPGGAADAASGLYYAAVRAEAVRDARVGAAAVLDVRIRGETDGAGRIRAIRAPIPRWPATCPE
ncbi:hypothetical protein [Embleya hyalina]|uniref:Uncharacterized protein n=1 Tax=Embleya hyalina TaxID=516124 RepID=A0A401Z4X6_9ACTN|nr:hypothetical protein [Embleya hyalina]GCE01899.1 hypothetical protein EHYA_09673 [Embleya hyalina]